MIDAFRCINPQSMMLGQEPRQTTSNIGHLHRPSIQALIHGLNRHYYSIPMGYRKNELEQRMLLNLHKRTWSAGLQVEKFAKHEESNAAVVKEMLDLAKRYHSTVKDEEEAESMEKLAIAQVGKIDAKKRLETCVENVMATNICQTLGSMLDNVVFS